MAPVARRAPSLVMMPPFCRFRGDAANGLTTADFPAADCKGKETMKPPMVLLLSLSFKCWSCARSTGFTPIMRTLFSCIPFFPRAFWASYRFWILENKQLNTVSNEVKLILTIFAHKSSSAFYFIYWLLRYKTVQNNATENWFKNLKKHTKACKAVLSSVIRNASDINSKIVCPFLFVYRESGDRTAR